jgi:glycosyltransferase involved in cell wall biosynthesis
MRARIVDSLRGVLSRLDRRPVASPVHLCHLLRSMGLDGTAGTVLDVSNGLNPKHYLVSILCVGDRGVLAQRVDPRVQVFALHDHEPGSRTIWRAARELRRYQVDLLHIHGADCYPWGAVAARLAGVAHVVHSGYGVKRGVTPPGLPPPVGRLALGWTDSFAADSEASAAALQAATGVPLERVQIIPRGVDTQKFRPPTDRVRPPEWLGIEQEQIVLGMVAPPREGSGHRLLLEVLGRLVAGGVDARAVLVGQGPEGERLEQEAAGAGLERRVCWTGQVPDVGAMMAGMDIFLWLDPARPGRSTQLEAMACGLPVVAASRGPQGGADLVLDGETGLLVPAGEAEILARILDDLCRDGDRRRKLGQGARAFVEQHHNLEEMVVGHRKLYDGVVGQEAASTTEGRVS